MKSILLKRKRKLNIAGSICTILQIFSYMGNASSTFETTGTGNTIGYIIGRNILLIAALIMFTKAAKINTQLQKKRD
jgi:hypothetical protein